jgi:tRNA(Ile)-lysidine synthase
MRSASASPLNRPVRAAEAAEPIAEDELDALFFAIEAASRVALAVSGGADSLALLDCFDRWRGRRHGRPAAIVLSVDHRLRENSGEEAAVVAGVAAARGYRARVLVWEGPRPESGVEAAARLARYRLMLGAAREDGASHLLLAHHRDDQAETFLMRLAGGSGLFGLAAMRREVSAGDLTIVRPFLDLPRTRLAATTAAAGLVPVDDPMNVDPRFLRARIRRALPLLAANGLGAAEIAAAAGRLAAAADAIDEAASRVLAAAVRFDHLAIARLDPVRFRGEPAEVRRRVLTRLLQAIGGEAYPPRSAKLEALDGAMAGARGRFKRTLAGTVIERRADGGFAFYRETGREGLPEVAVAGPAKFVWDHRFEITIGDRAPPDVMVGALGAAGRRAVGAPTTLAPADALAALPALRRAAEIVAVPSLSWRSAEAGGFAVAARSLIEERTAAPLRFPDVG